MNIKIKIDITKYNFFKILSIVIFLTSSSYSKNIENYINLKECDQVIDKEYYTVCYDYKLKNPRAVWYELNGSLVGENNIEFNSRYYSESNLEAKYKAKSKDYKNSGYDRGHLAPKAAFDFSIKSLRKIDSMINIVPQFPNVNRGIWKKLEKKARRLSIKIGSLKVINLIEYHNSKRIGKNQIAVPSKFYKILINNQKNYQECYSVDNIISTKSKRMKDYQVDCKTLKISN